MFLRGHFGTDVITLWLCEVTRRARCSGRAAWRTHPARWGSHRVSSPRAASPCSPPRGLALQGSRSSDSQTADYFLTVKNMNNKRCKKRPQCGTAQRGCWFGGSQSMAGVTTGSYTRLRRGPQVTVSDLEGHQEQQEWMSHVPTYFPYCLGFFISRCYSAPTRAYLGLHTWNFKWKKKLLVGSLPSNTVWSCVSHKWLLAIFLAINMRIRLSTLSCSLNVNENKWNDEYESLWGMWSAI